MDDAAMQQLHLARLTKHYLSMLASTVGASFAVTIREAGRGVWVIAVQLDGQEPQQIATTRGELKVWRTLTGAITFVQKNCATASSVIVEVGNWRFERLPNPLVNGV